MKQVILQSLSLSHWRGIDELTIDFSDRETSICGGNGTGKSSIYNAFMWLLFGKDSLNRKDFNIKPYGEERQLYPAEVEGSFLIDGQSVKLKRVYKEKWVTPRGETEQVFSGHTTDYFYNGVPLNMRDYESRVSGIIQEEVFKFITNPFFFATLEWKRQRDYLFSIVGEVKDEDIAEGNPAFTELLDKLAEGGKSFDDYRKEIKASKKESKDELKDIAPRIEQTRELMPKAQDFDQLREKLTAKEKEIERVDKKLMSRDEAGQEQDKEIEKLRKEIRGYKNKQDEYIDNADKLAQEETDKFNKDLKARKNKKKELEDLLKKERESATELLKDIKSKQDRIDSKSKEQNDLRAEWRRFNEANKHLDTTCPTCSQTLPQEQIQELQAKAEAKRTAKRKEINQQGTKLKEEIEKLEAEEKALKLSHDKKEQGIADLEAQIATLDKKLEGLTELTCEPISGEDLPEWCELSEFIEKLEDDIKELSEAKPSVDNSELLAEKELLKKERDAIKELLADEKTIKKHEKSISDLEQEGQRLSGIIADLEREEDLMSAFIKAKIETCNHKVNSLFTGVDFQLFDKTTEGNEYEVCIPLVDGVPFPVANSAGQLNAGLSIINTLCKHYGITAPIFIDNREGVNEIIPVQSQIINLVVTKDKQLVIQ